MESKTFVVDIGGTMFRNSSINHNPPFSSSENTSNHKQELHCECGYISKIKGKIARSVAFPHPDARDYGHKNEYSKITCDSCGNIYPDFEQVYLLEPGKEKLIEINYTEKVLAHLRTLTRERKYVRYVYPDTHKSKLEFASVYDQIQFNEQTKKSAIYIDNSVFEDANYLTSSKGNLSPQGQRKEKNISCDLILTNLFYINQFFGYLNYVNYTGLQEAFEFFKKMDHFIADIDEVKNLYHVKYFYETYKIHKKNIPHPNFPNKKITIPYRMLINRFGEEEKMESILHSGEYLESISEFARLFCSITSFSHITTILLTKGYVFFDAFLKSSYILAPDVYQNSQATYPAKIMDVSMKSISGSAAEVVNDNIKINNLIYKHIRKPEDIGILKKFLNDSILTKSELESLFLVYNSKDIFYVMGLCNNHYAKNNKISIKYIRHLLNHKYYKDFSSESKFSEVYFDTLKSLTAIIENQEKVKEYIKNNKLILSSDQLKSFDEYLNIKENTFFEIRTSKDLQKKHDDLSCIHAVFVDHEKSAKYIEAIKGFEYLNTEIDDVSFSVVNSMQEIHKEHVIMSHCIQTYSNQVVQKTFIPIRVFDNISHERATIGINRNNDKLTFSQLKGYCNSRATKFLIDTVLEYCKVSNISINSNQNFSLDLQPDERYEKKMGDYLLEEEVQKIRNKKNRNNINSNNPLSLAEINNQLKNNIN